jgi:NADH dehydrogenase [ubiquinone] 1 alpha subcomplex assembly factor 7
VTPPAPTDPGRRAPRFAETLSARADPTGFVRFDRFMEAALYDPELGYYTDPERTLGRAGDFYTAAHVAPTFAWAIGARLRAAWEQLGRPTPWRVVEVGPGDGTLAVDLVHYLEGHLPADATWEFELSDLSSRWEHRARERARSVAAEHIRVVGSGPRVPFVGAVVANEVLDAMPARRFRFTAGRWEEIGVRSNGDKLVEATRTAGTLPAGVNALASPDESAILEFAPGWSALLRMIADRLERGVAILVDYGHASAGERERSQGTLAAVRAHQDRPDPLADPGEADLSVFVDFTEVRATAARAGFSETAFRRQRDALGAWGYESLARDWIEAATEPTDRVRRQLASKKLLFGFESFYALELEAGLARPPASAGSS